MSDSSQGPGWWQASDGKWYPPEQAPEAAPQVPGSPGGGTTGLDVGAAISYGWNKFIQNIGPIVIIVLVIIVVELVFNVLARSMGSAFLSLILFVIGFVIALTISIGLIRAALAITAGEPVNPEMLFKTDQLGPYFVASLVVGLLNLIPCVGLVTTFFLFFYGFYIVDQQMGAGDALSASFNLVKEHIGELVLFLIVVLLLEICTCGLGWPIALIAGGYAYRTLNGQPVAP
jgi:uncharacterized membrane protein